MIVASFHHRTLVRALLLVWAALSLVSTVAAQTSVDTLAERLRKSGDFRVRTQAALALGASKNKEALEPLCDGLEDANATVRAAAAAALGRLSLGGKKCLEEQLAEETSGSVKTVIQKAIAQLEGDADPAVSEATRYYVAIGETTDKTGRAPKEVDTMVRTAIAQAATSESGYAVAPKAETRTAAEQVIAKFKQLRAYFLWPKVNPPQYANGNLTIKLEISIFTYPGKALKGTLQRRLTMPDVQPGDRASEDELIKAAAERAFEAFTQNVGSLE